MIAEALGHEVVTGRARLAALEPAWWDLFARARSARPFQSPAWLLPWAECCAPADNVGAIAVWSGATLVGLLPLELTNGSGRSRVRLLGRGISDYLDALVDPAASRAVLDGFARALPSLADAAAGFELTDVPRDSVLLELELPGFQRARAVSAPCPHVRLDRAFPELFARLPRWLARNVRQGEARLSRRGARFRLANAKSLARDVEAFLELHAARWGSRGETGVLHDPAVRRFHRQAAPRLHARDLLELLVICVDERPIAAAYVLTRLDAALYLTGFDPSFARYSLGSVLVARSLERAIDAGRARYDFLRGAEAYKYHFGASDSATATLTFERATSPVTRSAARQAEPQP